MASDESLPTLKILLIGASGAGRLFEQFFNHEVVLVRYCKDQYDHEFSTATIGVDFETKRVAAGGKPYRLTLLDTAGQERFRSLSKSYYRNAHGIMLVYDISNRQSFLSLDSWFEEVAENAVPGAITYLVGCKSDREAEGWRRVSADEGRAKATEKGAVGWCEVSSKTRTNVQRVFDEVIEAVVRDLDITPATAWHAGLVNLTGEARGYDSTCWSNVRRFLNLKSSDSGNG
ncbi:GTP-binding protein rab18a [Blumeria hordei DH14]|uniref:GTP-binding protein rab18a n=1 Tax=Blumeria graminis f. sp. hordei (strain DH14) TaxID=546991 RepID=N1JD52_BLUG1|nr:GTP-binding protein rab18a [Blumeria hordei DH14]